jgi:hypothetical protein
MGGTGTIPSVFLPVLRISCQIKGILQSKKFLKNPVAIIFSIVVTNKYFIYNFILTYGKS